MATLALDYNKYTLQIPASDKSFFLAFVKKMGWTAQKDKTTSAIPSATLRAVQEAKVGKDAGIVNMDSLNSFIKSMD